MCRCRRPSASRPRLLPRKLSMRVLSRCWQMLLKGVGEVQASGRPVAAAEMVLVRIAYAADLPTPDELVRSLGEERRFSSPARPSTNGGSNSATAGASASRCRATSRTASVTMRRAEPASSSAVASPRPSNEPVAQLQDRRGGRADNLAWLVRGADRWLLKSATSPPRWRWSATCSWCGSRTARSKSLTPNARAFVHDLQSNT